MTMPPSPHPPNTTTNELAKQRNQFAAERTLVVWIQNCVALIGFGIAFDRIFMALMRAFSKAELFTNRYLATLIGLSFIALGIVFLLIAIWQYCLAVQFLDRADYTTQPSQPWLTVVTTAIVAFGLVSTLAILIKGVN